MKSRTHALLSGWPVVITTSSVLQVATCASDPTPTNGHNVTATFFADCRQNTPSHRNNFVPPNVPSNMQMIVLELDDMHCHSTKDVVESKRENLSRESSLPSADLESWLSRSYPQLSYTAFSPIQRTASAPELDMMSFEASPKRVLRKRVSFSTVEIREYELPRRDHPRCQQDLSVSLDRLTTSIQKFNM